MRKLLTAAGLAAAALAVAACASSSSSSAPSAQSSAPAPSAQSSAPAAAGLAASVVMERTMGGTQVLTNSAGLTLYWFGPDTSTASKCTGSCATYWPPVKGPVTAGSGVTGTLGVITRPDDTMQATYDGHPLYTYAGDSAPGQDNGDDKNLSGGVWHEVTVSGSSPAPSPSVDSRSHGGDG